MADSHTWTRSKPRGAISARIKEEYRDALDQTIREGRAHGMTNLEKYDVLEYLLRELLTPEGRAEVRKRIREEWPPRP